jgi:hypothetical protein
VSGCDVYTRVFRLDIGDGKPGLRAGRKETALPAQVIRITDHGCDAT